VFKSATLEAPACYIPNVCISEAKVVYVPDYLSATMTNLVACGLPRVEFYPSSALPESSGPRAPHVLVSPNVPRDHMPHFMQDFGAQLTALDMFFGEPAGSAETVVYCRSSGPAAKFKVGNARDGGAVPKSLETAFLLDAKVKEEYSTGPWVRKFISFLPTTGEAAVPLYVDELFDAPKKKACFKGLVTSPSNALPSSLSRKHAIFEKNGISKRESTGCEALQVIILDRYAAVDCSGVPPPFHRGLGLTRCFVCLLLLLATHRKDQAKTTGRNVQSGRNIVNIKDFEQAIGDLRTQNPQYKFDLTTEYFEGATFERQIEVMQKADMIVAVHGAALTNVIFMRPRASLIELMPFGYVATLFVDMAASVNVRVQQVISEPDPERFEACLHRWNREDSEYFKNVEPNINLFKSVAERYIASGRKKDVIHLPFKQVTFASSCVRSQRLNLPIKVTVKILATWLEKRCA